MPDWGAMVHTIQLPLEPMLLFALIHSSISGSVKHVPPGSPSRGHLSSIDCQMPVQADSLKCEVMSFSFSLGP